MKIKLLIALSLFIILSACSQDDAEKITYQNEFKLSPEDEEFLDTLQYKSFLYFINEINPENGLVKDRSTESSPASIAATGFGVSVWIIGVEHGWMKREDAAKLTLAMLRFLINSEQSAEPVSTGYKGFYYHFIDMKTGERVWNCELSSIDTAWLLAGIIFARQYFNLDNEAEFEIRNLAVKILSRVDWNFMALSDSSLHPNTVSMAWKPERGLNNFGWAHYNEGMFLFVLAASMGYDKIDEAYKYMLSTYEWHEPYEGLAHVIFPPLFGHQYSHMFVDFRGIKDSYMKNKGIDYFENSRRAVLTQQKYAIENPMNWKGYDSLTWGLTACDGPGPKYNNDDRKFRDYSARGASGPNKIEFDDGTIAPTAAGGSIVFAPEIVIPTLKEMKKRYGSKGLWDKYGFVDAFNLTVDWFDSDYLGIDQGPIVIMIENLRTELVWNYVMKDPLIINGLKRLGFN